MRTFLGVALLLELVNSDNLIHNTQKQRNNHLPCSPSVFQLTIHVYIRVQQYLVNYCFHSTSNIYIAAKLLVSHFLLDYVLISLFHFLRAYVNDSYTCNLLYTKWSYSVTVDTTACRSTWAYLTNAQTSWCKMWEVVEENFLIRGGKRSPGLGNLSHIKLIFWF